jgi:hypothetical protein
MKTKTAVPGSVTVVESPVAPAFYIPPTPTTANGQPKLRMSDFLTQGVVLGKLAEGAHIATLELFTPIDGNADDGSKDYMKLQWKLEDRVVTDNRFFAGLIILLEQIKSLTHIDSQNPAEILSSILNKSVVLYCSYSISAKDGKTYRNFSLSKPASVEALTETVTPEGF